MLKKDAIKLVQPNTKKSVSKFNVYSPKKGLQTSPCDKPKEIEQTHYLYLFQNGGLFLLKKALLKRDYMCKIDLKDAYFSVPLNPESQKLVSFKWKDLIYQFLSLCFVLGPAPRIFFKITESFHFSDEKVKCSIDNFSDGCLGRGVDIGTGHSHLPTSELRFFDQHKEICASSVSNYTVFGHGDKLRRFDYNSSTGEKGPDSKTVSRSSVEVISFNTGVDGTYWGAGINSHRNFASTTPISSNAAPANIGVICGKKLQLRNKTIRRGEDRTAMVVTESSLKQWEVSYIYLVLPSYE